MTQDALTLNENLDPQKPLLICDVDEVILHFVAPFEEFLASRNAQLKKQSFKLSGNIIDLASGSAYSMKESGELIQEFHNISVDQQSPVDGAIAGLKRLSETYAIVFLTNVAATLTERRREHLASIGAPYPVLQNEGSKANMVQTLAKDLTAPIVFIDDLPPHHLAVKAAEPRVNCIHFMADDTYRSIVTFDAEIGKKTESWSEIIDHCEMLVAQGD
ncbi:MAG: hypothetical protein ABJK39_11280 [Hyphomicrobiales bacterium]